MPPEDAAVRRLYLEDLELGQRFGSGTVAVTPEAIKAFAREFDPQLFHVDEEAAKATFFGGLAASGWHTAALTMKLLVGGAYQPVGGLIGSGADDLRWPRPVRPGDVLRVECEVLEIQPSQSRPDRGRARVRITTFNQADEPVQIMTANMVVPRRPASST
ncbi:MaoC family dehydratase [Inquilinus sp. CA228]|uniref:MaoC family dehydratase n=1 Tax=Inquilinus sp. CA228 TaxID=3455609 RepID=UPI003F8D4594